MAFQEVIALETVAFTCSVDAWFSGWMNGWDGWMDGWMGAGAWFFSLAVIVDRGSMMPWSLS